MRSQLPSQNEIERRHKNIRSRMATAGVDALIICGNQYAGFEGAVFYASGFEIVHRYVYVLLPLEDEPTLVFPLAGPPDEAQAHFKCPGHRVVAAGDLLLYSLEITGAGGYWVEFSRPLLRGNPSATTQKMAEAYLEALQAARKLMRAGELASSVHRAIAETFAKYGFSLGHLSGHSIGTTMIECPAIGAKSEVPLEENMIFSLHPQVVDQDGKVCLYTQDTYRIGKSEGECLANVPWRFFAGQETMETATR